MKDLVRKPSEFKEERRLKTYVKKHSDSTGFPIEVHVEKPKPKDHVKKHSGSSMFPIELSDEKPTKERIVRVNRELARSEAAAPTNVGSGSRATHRRRELRRRRRLGATEANA